MTKIERLMEQLEKADVADLRVWGSIRGLIGAQGVLHEVASHLDGIGRTADAHRIRLVSERLEGPVGSLERLAEILAEIEANERKCKEDRISAPWDVDLAAVPA